MKRNFITFCFVLMSLHVVSSEVNAGCADVFPDKLPQSIFVTQQAEDPLLTKISEQFAHMKPEDQEALRERLAKTAGFPVEPIPMIVDRSFYKEIVHLAKLMALAGQAFLHDVYGSSSPRIYKKYPELKYLVESSPYFTNEIVGTPMANEIPWDVVGAMDFAIINNPDGTLSIRPQELDFGSMGGIRRIGWAHKAIENEWGTIDGFGRFENSWKPLEEQIAFHAQKGEEFAQALGLKKDEYIVIWYQEANNPKLFEPGSPAHPMKDLISHYGIEMVSTWNKNDLEYDEQRNMYKYKGKWVTAFYWGYYSNWVDPTMPSYQKVGDYFKNEYEVAHALPSFVRHYVNGGYKNWYMWNPYGTDLFADKGISGYLFKMVEFYLNSKPSINEIMYQPFIDAHGVEDMERIQRVFANQGEQVIKSRSSASHGAGVYVGNSLINGKTKNGLSWSDLETLVMQYPSDFVSQDFFGPEHLINTPTGQRTFEGRVIVWIGSESLHPGGLYIRSAPIGVDIRNLTGNDKASIIPVLIPKQ